MASTEIIIKVKDGRTGQTREQAFRSLPIRIGRNPLNDLVIDDDFVSQWHGIIRRDGPGMSFMDLGSTNGSFLDGTRVSKDVAVPLMANSLLNIAQFQLVVAASLIGGEDSDKGASSARREGHPVAQKSSDSPAALASGDDPKLVRCLQILQGFAEAFVALRNGYQEFGEQVGVLPIGGRSPLHRARTGSEVVQHLLDSTRPVEACLAELKAVFADMGIHQIAFMEGISQSVRALLESLNPAAQPKSPSVFGRLRGRSRSSDSDYDLNQRFAVLMAEDEALHAEIFGETFVRAYASVAMGAGSEQKH